MMTQTRLEALAILRDTTRPARERETAIHTLAGKPDERAIDQLVQTLSDDDFGLRWAAARALSYAGRPALIPLLRKLISDGSRSTVRDVVQHVLNAYTDPAIREQLAELLEALKGPAADIATPQAAFNLLKRLQTLET